MTPEERDLINGLFDRLKNIGPTDTDPEAERLIQAQVASLPQAPYHLVQTLLVQEHALQNAQLRIHQLQQQLAPQAQPQQPALSQGGFLSGLFHRGQSVPPPLPAYPTTAAMAPSAGGGFLRSALTTAAGVAGGSFLFQGIEDLLGHRSGAFGSMLGGGYGGGGIMPPDNVEVINNYYGGDARPGQGGSFLQTGGADPGSIDQSFQGADPGAGVEPGNDPGLGVDWGSNIDPGPGPDPGSLDLDSGGSDGGSIAV